MFIISDLLSVLPSSNAGTASPLQIGQALPLEIQGRFKEVQNENSEMGPIMIYIPRHCGCPFPERDIHHLYTLISRNIPVFEESRARIIVLPHASTPEACQNWFDQVFSAATAASKSQELEPRIRKMFFLVPDPSRTFAKSLSFGLLETFGALFSTETFGEVFKLKKETGIKNRETAAGSNRWSEHGAIWSDKNRDGELVVKWIEKPKVASGECDWAKGWKEAGIQLD